MQTSGTTFAGSPELLVELRRHLDRPLRAQLEDGLRDAARSGRLAAGARLPATRALAADLGVSRRLVVEAYAQLLAEGYLTGRRGAGTYVSGAAPGGRGSRPAPPPHDPRRARSTAVGIADRRAGRTGRGAAADRVARGRRRWRAGDARAPVSAGRRNGARASRRAAGVGRRGRGLRHRG